MYVQFVSVHIVLNQVVNEMEHKFLTILNSNRIQRLDKKICNLEILTRWELQSNRDVCQQQSC